MSKMIHFHLVVIWQAIFFVCATATKAINLAYFCKDILGTGSRQLGNAVRLDLCFFLGVERG